MKSKAPRTAAPESSRCHPCTDAIIDSRPCGSHFSITVCWKGGRIIAEADAGAAESGGPPGPCHLLLMLDSGMFKGKGPGPADLPRTRGEGDVIKNINKEETHPHSQDGNEIGDCCWNGPGFRRCAARAAECLPLIPAHEALAEMMTRGQAPCPSASCLPPTVPQVPLWRLRWVHVSPRNDPAAGSPSMRTHLSSAHIAGEPIHTLRKE